MLKMVETLQTGGFTDQQARAMTTGEAAGVARIASRDDLMDVQIDMKHDFDAVETKLTNSIAALDTRLTYRIDALELGMKHDFNAVRAELASLELRMTVRLGGIVVACFSVLFASQNVFH